MTYRVKFLPCIRVALFASLFFFVLFLPKVYASTFVSDDIFSDTTWTLAGSPYIIESNIYIGPSATLSIEAGVVVKFYGSPSRSMYVEGVIKSLGTSEAPVYFTSFYDDSVASEVDDETDCYFIEYDEEGNGVGEEICEVYDWYDPIVGDWQEIYFDHSEGNIFEHTFFKYSNTGLTFFTSQAEFKSVSFLETKDVLNAYNDSHITFSGFDISSVYDDPITIFNNSSFVGEKLTMVDMFATRTDAIVIFNNSDLSLKDSTFTNCPNEACITFFDGRDDFYQINPSSITVKDSVFDGGLGSAFLTFGSTMITTDISGSVITGFEYFGIENYSAFPVYAEGNFWGYPSGPFHDTLNLVGEGELMYGPMDFEPWLTRDPRDVCKVDCFSNLLFLPGMEGSRLYGLIDDEEKELWYSRKDSHHEYMYLNQDGDSINNIYTKDDTQNTGEDKETGIIDEATLGINIYESFIDRMRQWKEGGVIEDYAFVPYDWRLPLSQIISGGKLDNGNLSYMNGDADMGEAYLVAKLRDLAESSKSGKVSIVAHSYGGIVTKALIQKLKDSGDPLYEKIDKVILVAVPQIGTPQAAVALLHGTGLGPANLVMDTDISRTFAENMETAYNLLPRDTYFKSVDPKFEADRLISFPNEKLFKIQRDAYGAYILDQKELRDYILGTDGREKPSHHDTKSPNIGNNIIYDRAEEIYKLEDEWVAPAGTKVVQVAGWGAETISGLDYKVYLKSFNPSSAYISYKLRKVIDGDGTVVAPSALWMPESDSVERWWVNLEAYDTLTRYERAHADILEIPNLLSFLDSQIKNTDFSDIENIITRDTSTLVAKGKRLHYTLHSPLYLGVFDSEDRFTGRDKDGVIHEEIPGVDFTIVGEVQMLSVPADITHTLRLVGFAEGVFALDIDQVSGNDTLGSILFQNVASKEGTIVNLSVPIDIESLIDLKLNIDDDGDGIIDRDINPWQDEAPPSPTSSNSGGGGGVVGLQFLNNIIAPIISPTPEVLGASIDSGIEQESDKSLPLVPEPKAVNSVVNKSQEVNNIEISPKDEILVQTPTQDKEKSSNIPVFIFLGIIILIIGAKLLIKIK